MQVLLADVFKGRLSAEFVEPCAIMKCRDYLPDSKVSKEVPRMLVSSYRVNALKDIVENEYSELISALNNYLDERRERKKTQCILHCLAQSLHGRDSLAVR